MQAPNAEQQSLSSKTDPERTFSEKSFRTKQKLLVKQFMEYQQMGSHSESDEG